jgi:hypothetical protein
VRLKSYALFLRIRPSPGPLHEFIICQHKIIEFPRFQFPCLFVSPRFHHAHECTGISHRCSRVIDDIEVTRRVHDCMYVPLCFTSHPQACMRAPPTEFIKPDSFDNEMLTNPICSDKMVTKPDSFDDAMLTTPGSLDMYSLVNKPGSLGSYSLFNKPDSLLSDKPDSFSLSDSYSLLDTVQLDEVSACRDHPEAMASGRRGLAAHFTWTQLSQCSEPAASQLSQMSRRLETVSPSRRHAVLADMLCTSEDSLCLFDKSVEHDSIGSFAC